MQKELKSIKEFDYYNIERVRLFSGNHPSLMNGIIEKADWEFDPDKIHKSLNLKDRIAYWIEDRINHRIGEYKNYKIIQ